MAKKFIVMFVLILASMSICAQTKITPTLTITPTEQYFHDHALLGDTEFVEPTYSIVANGADIINDVNVTWSILNSDGSTSDTDASTGTKVDRDDGQVDIGNKAGDVTIQIKATPKTNYASKYNACTSTYTIHIDAIAPIGTNKYNGANINFGKPSFSDDQMTAYVGQTIPAKTWNIKYVYTEKVNSTPYTIDVTSKYSASYSILEGGSLLSLATNGSVTAKAAGTAKVLYTYRAATTGYENTYTELKDTIYLTINPLTAGHKIKLSVKYPEGTTQYLYSGSYNNTPLQYSVVDEFGNDLTSYFTSANMGCFTIEPNATNKDKCNNADENGAQAWGWNTLHAGMCKNDSTKYRAPIFKKIPWLNNGYQFKIDTTYSHVWVKIENLPSTLNSDLYDITDAYGGYLLKNVPRIPSVTMTPDPSTVGHGVKKGSYLEFDKVYDVKGLYIPKCKDDMGSKILQKGDSLIICHTADNPTNGFAMKYEFLIADSLLDSSKHDPYIEVIGFNPDNICHDTILVKGVPVPYTTYLSDKGYGNYKDWRLKFNKAGNYPIRYRMFSWQFPTIDDGTNAGEVADFIVTDKQSVKIIINPNVLTTTKSNTNFGEPNVSVVTTLGNDVTSRFNYQYYVTNKVQTKNADGTYSTTYKRLYHGKQEDQTLTSVNDSSIHQVTIGSETGDVVIRVIAIPKTEYEDYYDTDSATYLIHIKDISGTLATYEIINHSGSDDHGKLHFIDAGSLLNGMYIDGIPGLNVGFGTSDATTWSVTKQTGWTDAGDVITSNSNADESTFFAATGDQDVTLKDRIPTSGTFYTLVPKTNGFLTIDADLSSSKAYLYNASVGLDSTTVSTKGGDAKFIYSLLAGNSYYLYRKDLKPLTLHGMNFSPAFINSRTDKATVDPAYAYTNRYVGSLPHLLTTPNPCVTFRPDKTENNVAEVDPSTGDITIIASAASSSNYEQICGDVKSAENASIVKTPSYKLYVLAIPQYAVSKGEIAKCVNPGDFGNKVGSVTYNDSAYHTTNYQTDIRMYYGYAGVSQYMASGIITSNPNDSWLHGTDIVADGYAYFMYPIDGFNYTVTGTGKKNPLDEVGKTFDYSLMSSDHKTWDLPIYGSFARFEPEQDGMLMVYVQQQGVCPYNGNGDWGDGSKKNYLEIKTNPLFITDESGRSITVDDKKEFYNYGKNPLYNDIDADLTEYGAYVNGCFRAGIDACDSVKYTGGSVPANKEWNWHADVQNTETNIQAVKSYWKSYGKSKIIGLNNDATYTFNDITVNRKAGTYYQKVFRLANGGYILISKDVVRYLFRVNSGKTYFVFQPQAGNTYLGYAFLPDKWNGTNADKQEIQEVTIGDGTGVALSSITKDVRSNVKFYRVFNKNTDGTYKWNSICLPFSVNMRQFKQVFGSDALLIGYDGLRNGKYPHFTQHVYQMIEAGRPYFFKPGTKMNLKKDEKGTYLYFKNVTFEKNIDPSDTYYQTDTTTRTIDLGNTGTAKTFRYTKGYKMIGTFDTPVIMNTGDKYIGSDSLKTLNKDGVQCKPYRAFLKLEKETNPAKEDQPLDAKSVEQVDLSWMKYVSSNEESTDIKMIEEINANDSGRDGIYSISGQLISKETSDLQGLQKGIYIINGKKVIKK